MLTHETLNLAKARAQKANKFQTELNASATSKKLENTFSQLQFLKQTIAIMWERHSF